MFVCHAARCPSERFYKHIKAHSLDEAGQLLETLVRFEGRGFVKVGMNPSVPVLNVPQGIGEGHSKDNFVLKSQFKIREGRLWVFDPAYEVPPTLLAFEANRQCKDVVGLLQV